MMRQRNWLLFIGFAIWGIRVLGDQWPSSPLQAIAPLLVGIPAIPWLSVAAFVAYAVIRYVGQLLHPNIPQTNDLSRYSAIRGTLQTGDVIAFNGTDFLSGLFRRFTRSRYSHVGMVVVFADLREGERVFVLEALDKKGVVLMPLSAKLYEYQGQAWWFQLQAGDHAGTVPATVRERIYEYLMQQLGKQYDYQDIKQIVQKILKVGRALSRAEDTTRLICSELVARALQQAGLHTFVDCSSVTPGEITALPVLVFKNQIL